MVNYPSTIDKEKPNLPEGQAKWTVLTNDLYTFSPVHCQYPSHPRSSDYVRHPARFRLPLAFDSTLC